MFGIGMPELAVIFVVALIVLGPKRLPEVARSLGKGLAEFRRVTGDVNREIESARSMIEREAREHDAARRALEREQAARLATSGAAAPAAEPIPSSAPPTTQASGEAIARASTTDGGSSGGGSPPSAA